MEYLLGHLLQVTFVVGILWAAWDRVVHFRQVGVPRLRRRWVLRWRPFLLAVVAGLVCRRPRYLVWSAGRPVAVRGARVVAHHRGQVGRLGWRRGRAVLLPVR